MSASRQLTSVAMAADRSHAVAKEVVAEGEVVVEGGVVVIVRCRIHGCRKAKVFRGELMEVT